ncbi:MAG: hypothetical protein OEL54_01675 [Flavobacteriaceae bacterium]|nr:hypothetical protein [Flavobacteriaceae bacterium]
MEKDNLKHEQRICERAFRFADFVNGKHVDEIFKASDRNKAIRIMNEKYPNHEFALVHELF